MSNTMCPFEISLRSSLAFSGIRSLNLKGWAPLLRAQAQFPFWASSVGYYRPTATNIHVRHRHMFACCQHIIILGGRLHPDSTDKTLLKTSLKPYLRSFDNRKGRCLKWITHCAISFVMFPYIALPWLVFTKTSTSWWFIASCVSVLKHMHARAHTQIVLWRLWRVILACVWESGVLFFFLALFLQLHLLL